MTYKGIVKGGAIVLEGTPDLPEGLTVLVTVPAAAPAEDDAGLSLQSLLLTVAGQAEGLPEDAARNHDHYLYGTRKS